MTFNGGRHDVLNDALHRTAAATVVLFLERLRLSPELPAIAEALGMSARVTTTVAELRELLAPDGRPVLLDVRWALGDPHGRDHYAHGHIPGAVYVDLDTELAGAAEPARGPASAAGPRGAADRGPPMGHS